MKDEPKNLTLLERMCIWFCIILASAAFGYYWCFKSFELSIYPEQTVSLVASPEVKAAMNKMGPRFDYKMVGERLYVAKWERLHYKGEQTHE